MASISALIPVIFIYFNRVLFCWSRSDGKERNGCKETSGVYRPCRSTANFRFSLETRIATVLAHGRYILGQRLQDVKRLAAYVSGVKHCIGVASGANALLMAWGGLGLRRSFCDSFYLYCHG